MSIKIHHGAPGSYKTSGAVYEDLIRELKAGRYIVSNVRGLDLDKIKKVIRKNETKGLIKSILKYIKPEETGDKLEHATLINIDIQTEEGRNKLRTFFHWAPKGAFFLIDEINRVYETRETAKQLELLNYKTLDESKDDNKPHTVQQAFEMHRHYNWDFVVTTPDIKVVNPMIKGISDMAYYHRNKGVIGLTGYWEIMHEPINSGKAKSDILQQRNVRLPGWVFELYGSTSTGEHSDTKSGRNLIINSKVISITVVFFILFIFLGGKIKNIFTRNDVKVVEIEENKTEKINKLNQGNYTQRTTRSKPKYGGLQSEIINGKVYYVGSIIDKLFLVDTPMLNTTITEKTLNKIDIKVVKISNCNYLLKTKNQERFVSCQKHIVPSTKRDELSFGDLAAAAKNEQ